MEEYCNEYFDDMWYERSEFDYGKKTKKSKRYIWIDDFYHFENHPYDMDPRGLNKKVYNLVMRFNFGQYNRKELDSYENSIYQLWKAGTFDWLKPKKLNSGVTEEEFKKQLQMMRDTYGLSWKTDLVTLWSLYVRSAMKCKKITINVAGKLWMVRKLYHMMFGNYMSTRQYEQFIKYAVDKGLITPGLLDEEDKDPVLMMINPFVKDYEERDNSITGIEEAIDIWNEI